MYTGNSRRQKAYYNEGVKDVRGSAANRRARKHWMLNTFGDGQKVECVHCGAMQSFETLQADRIDPTGTYKRSNVQPSCGGCNRRRSNNRLWVSPVLTSLSRSMVALG